MRCEEEALESFSHLLCGRGHAIGSHSAPLFVGGCRENRSPKGRSALAELGVRATVRNAVRTDRHPATHEVADFRSPPVEAIQRVRREFPDRLVEKEHSPVCASVGRPAGRAPGREMHPVDRAGFVVPGEPVAHLTRGVAVGISPPDQVIAPWAKQSGDGSAPA